MNVPADALDEHVVKQFFQHFVDVEVDLLYDDNTLRIAQEALDDAEAELRTWVTVMSVRDEGFRAGYDARNQAVGQARDALTKAQTAARGFALPPDLAAEWGTLPDQRKRTYLGAAFELVAVRSARGWREDIATRTRIWFRNEAGAPDVSITHCSPITFPDDAPPGAGVTAA